MKKTPWAITVFVSVGLLALLWLIESRRWPLVAAGMGKKQVYAAFERSAARYIRYEAPRANTTSWVRDFTLFGPRWRLSFAATVQFKLFACGGSCRCER
jgi:hypothetical protein